jgi:hypothetical protein
MLGTSLLCKNSLLGFRSLNPQSSSALTAFSGTGELRGDLRMGLRKFGNDSIDSFAIIAEPDTRIGYQRLAEAGQLHGAELGHDLPDLIPQMGLRRFQWCNVALNLAQIALQRTQRCDVGQRAILPLREDVAGVGGRWVTHHNPSLVCRQ